MHNLIQFAHQRTWHTVTLWTTWRCLDLELYMYNMLTHTCHHMLIMLISEWNINIGLCWIAMFYVVPSNSRDLHVDSKQGSPAFWKGEQSHRLQLVHLYMDVSENRGTPKSSILIGFSIINHPLFLETPKKSQPSILGYSTPIFLETPISIVTKQANTHKNSKGMSAISVSIGVSKNVNQNVQNEGRLPARKTCHLLGDGDIATSGVSEFSPKTSLTNPKNEPNTHHFQWKGKANIWESTPYLFNLELVLVVANDHSFLVLQTQIKQTRMFIDPGLILHMCVYFPHPKLHVIPGRLDSRKLNMPGFGRDFFSCIQPKRCFPKRKQRGRYLWTSSHLVIPTFFDARRFLKPLG